MRTNTEISFGLFDVSAKEDSTPAVSDKQPFINVNQLKETDLPVRAYGTMELNQFILDGSLSVFPGSPESENFGLWSRRMSDVSCTFSEAIVLTITFAENHSSLGLTFHFSEDTQDYCNHLNVKWFDSGERLMADQDYHPDQAAYFAERKIEDYRKLVITFFSTNKPFRYLKLSELKYGVLKCFGEESIISASIIEELDPLSAEISINTLEFKIHSKDFEILDMQGAYSLLQKKQKVDVLQTIDGRKIEMGTFYLDEPESEANHTTTMRCVDLVGILDNTQFRGGMYHEISAEALIGEIMESAGADYELEDSLKRKKLSGHIPICSHREALQQAAFALGVIVNCARSSKIRIYSLPKEADSHVGYSRKVLGHKMKLKTLVTGVEITAHNFLETTETLELFDSNLAAGTYEILFDQPAHTLTVQGAGITESNANYALIQVEQQGNVLLKGRGYKDNSRLIKVQMEDFPANEKANVIKVDQAFLISDDNAEAVAKRVFDYYQDRYEDEGAILLGNEKVGDLVLLDGMNDRKVKGTVESLDIDLSGGFIGKMKMTGQAVSQ